MVEQRQLERLLKQVQRLRQRDEYWAVTTRLARMWITPGHESPYRPYLTFLLSQQGKILGSYVHNAEHVAALTPLLGALSIEYSTVPPGRWRMRWSQ
jgi:hypothetical protein